MMTTFSTGQLPSNISITHPAAAAGDTLQGNTQQNFLPLSAAPINQQINTQQTSIP